MDVKFLDGLFFKPNPNRFSVFCTPPSMDCRCYYAADVEKQTPNYDSDANYVVNYIPVAAEIIASSLSIHASSDCCDFCA